MILISLGSSQFDFSRLLKAVEKLVEGGVIKDAEINAQLGTTKYDSKYMNCFSMVSDFEFKKMVSEADVIITHAGIGCIMSAIRQGKKTIIFPRLEKYSEHLDNHQLEIAKAFSKQGYLLLATSENELKNCFCKLDMFVPKKYISNSQITRIVKEKLNVWGI